MLEHLVADNSLLLQQGLPYGYIANLCVDRSARQRGVGSALMQRVLNIAREWSMCLY